MTETRFVDRGGWKSGPWDAEDDRYEWRSETGLPCLILRSNGTGALCGYVAVPPGHLLHGADYSDLEEHGGVEIEVHGGLTYSDRCAGRICHVPAPGEPDDVWWFGFDCAHGWDVCPMHDATYRRFGMAPSPFFEGRYYRDVAYVRAEVERLARQLSGRGGAR